MTLSATTVCRELRYQVRLIEHGLLNALVSKCPAGWDGLTVCVAGSGSPPNQPVDESTSPKRHLIVKILPGRAFVGNLVQDELLDGQQSASTLQAFLHMGSTRVASKEVLATVEPPFNESCAFLLQDRLDTSLRELVHSTLTLQLAIVHTDPVGAKTLTGSQRCEWRQVIEHLSLPLSV